MNSLTLFILTFLIVSTLCKNHRKVKDNVYSNRKLCSFEDQLRKQPPNRVNTTSRLIALRNVMLEADAVLVTSNDEHQTSYVSDSDKRRQYISGFSGSSGDALITKSKALLWTDGRYHLQADDELDCNWILMREGNTKVPSMSEWLNEEFPNGAKIGADAKLIPVKVWNDLEKELKKLNENFIIIDTPKNLIDAIWKNRPQEMNDQAYTLDIFFTGKSWKQKVRDVRREIAKDKATAMVVTALDEISWLLNIRGSDVPYTGFLKAYVILSQTDVILYTNLKKIQQNVSIFFKNNYPGQLKFKKHDDIWLDLSVYVSKWKRILIPSFLVFSLGASKKIYDIVPLQKRLHKPSPIIPLMAKKNPTEISGMRRAHIRDAAALCMFFSNLESRYENGEKFHEYKAVMEVQRIRHQQRFFVTESYPDIIGYGLNGALPHYHPTPATSSVLGNKSTIVMDTGAQYYDGTIDVTRTIHLGNPTKEHQEAYTRVLIGSIQLSKLIFPDNVNTSSIDIMARAPLWEVGYDYPHGTGHGIGAFRNVHESPVDVRYLNRKYVGLQSLKPGYFLSGEPGFYIGGQFGIRLENILQVITIPHLKELNGHKFLGFDTITLVPYSPKLIEYSLLDRRHRQWLNKYNSQIRTLVGSELLKQNSTEAYSWMMKNTEHIPDQVKYS